MSKGASGPNCPAQVSDLRLRSRAVGPCVRPRPAAGRVHPRVLKAGKALSEAPGRRCISPTVSGQLRVDAGRGRAAAPPLPVSKEVRRGGKQRAARRVRAPAKSGPSQSGEGCEGSAEPSGPVGILASQKPERAAACGGFERVVRHRLAARQGCHA